MARDETMPLLYGGSVEAVNTAEQPAKQRSDRKRLVSLDATRGLTVFVMIFVDNTGGVLRGRVDHSPWNHVTFADFVMPFFLFMVGMSMSLSFQKYQAGLFKKVVWRTVKLFALGLLTQGGDFPSLGSDGYNLKTLRFGGILQRIAFAYFVVASMALFLPKLKDSWRDHRFLHSVRMIRVYFFHWLVALSWFFLYVALILGVHVPSYSFVTTAIADGVNVPLGCNLISPGTYECHVECDVRGDLTPKCSAIRHVDQFLLQGFDHFYDGGEFRRLSNCSMCSPGSCPYSSDRTTEAADAWCYSRLDPEGALSSFPTVLTAWLGLFFGNVLVHNKSHRDRLRAWAPLAVVWFVLGIIIHASGWLMNKQMWSPSYVFMMAGSTGFVSMLFYVLLDVIPSSSLVGKATLVFRPLVWVGMNTIFIYLLSPAAGIFESLQTFVYWDSPEHNLRDESFANIFCKGPYTCPAGLNVTCDDEMMACGPSCDSYTCGGAMFEGKTMASAWVLFTLCRIAFWFAVAGLLHRKKLYYAL